MRTSRLLLLVFLVLLPAASARERSFSEARAAMRKGLRSNDPNERSLAVYELDGFDDAAAARSLVRRVLSREDRAQVHRAALQLLGAMRSEEALEVLAEESVKGPPLKRARVLEALGKWRSEEVVPAVLAAAYDDDPRVRIAAILAMERLPGARLDLAISDGLSSELWAVRSAAVFVLLQRRTERAIGPLIERLAEGRETGRLLDDVRKALVALTGEDFGFSHRQWLLWHRAKLELQAPERVLADVPAPEPRAELAGVRTRARGVLYLLALNESMSDELSGTMAERIPEDVRRAGGPELREWEEAETKLDLARLWVARSLDGLAPDARFDVVTYASSANAVFGELVPATPQNRERAKRRILGLSAGGNANLYDGLRRAFEIVDRDPTAVESVRNGPEAIFYVGDGTCDSGEIEDGFRAVEQAERWNRYRQVRLHTFGPGRFDTRILSSLAGLIPGGEIVGL